MYLAALLVCGLVGASSAATDELSQASSTDLSATDEAATDSQSDYVLPYEVVVRARRTLSRDMTADQVLVAGQELRDSPRPSMLEALAQESSSVYVPGRGALHGIASGASGGIYVRGLGGSPNSQVLVVEDGVPDFMGIFGHPIPDAYVPFLLEDALIVKGGDSVLYGTNALGGAIVLRSRWRAEEGVEFSNDAAYGSYMTLRETAALLGKSGALDYSGAFHAMSTDGHRAGAGGKLVVAQAAARYALGPRLRLGARHKLVRLEGGDPGPETHPHPDNWFEVWRANSSVALEYQGYPLSLNARAFFNLGEHRLYDGFFSRDYVAGLIGEGRWRMHRSASLLFGVQAQQVGGEVLNRISAAAQDVQGLADVAAMGQLSWRPLPSLLLVTGARLLHSFSYGLMPLYKVGGRWDIFGNLYAQTRFARNYRQPTIRELYLPYPVANPELRPELAHNWDVGLGYDKRPWELRASLYRTHARNMIRYFGFWPAAEVVNIDRITIWGVEARAGLRELGPLSLSVGADWRERGRYTRQNPDTKMDVMLELAHVFAEHFLGASFAGHWVSGLYMANYGREPIDDVFSLDLALRYRYLLPERGISVEPYVFVRNVINRRNAYVAGYPMPGLHVLAGLKLGL